MCGNRDSRGDLEKSCSINLSSKNNTSKVSFLDEHGPIVCFWPRGYYFPKHLALTGGVTNVDDSTAWRHARSIGSPGRGCQTQQSRAYSVVRQSVDPPQESAATMGLAIFTRTVLSTKRFCDCNQLIDYIMCEYIVGFVLLCRWSVFNRSWDTASQTIRESEKRCVSAIRLGLDMLPSCTCNTRRCYRCSP